MKRVAKKVLDKTTIDDRIVGKAKSIADKTTIDDKFLHVTKALHREVKKNMGTAILAAFAFMIALVWRDVVQTGVSRIEEFLNLTGGDGFWFAVLTALLTTVICVLGIIYFSRWSEKK